jgi:hypothetical protein
MNASDFSTIETRLQLVLPSWYKTTLASYPFPKEEPELFGSAEEVIRHNEGLRKEGWFDFPWPPSFFALGEDGCGNFYFAHLANDDRRIYIADHDGGPEPRVESLDEMLSSASLDDHIRETFEIQQKLASHALAQPRRKWWQFWR